MSSLLRRTASAMADAGSFTAAREGDERDAEDPDGRTEQNDEPDHDPEHEHQQRDDTKAEPHEDPQFSSQDTLTKETTKETSRTAQNGNHSGTFGLEPSAPIEDFNREYDWRKSRGEQDPGHFRRKKRRTWFGLEPDRRLKQHHEGAEILLWSRIRSTLQEPMSEFLGVLVFTMIQQGGVAQAVLSVGQATAPGGDGYGTYLTVPFTTGIGVLLGVYIAGDSGSYLNPAITVANCLFRGLPWRVMPMLTLAQTFGAFCGTGITFGIYKPAINMYSGGALLVSPTPQATASIFTSFPQEFSSTTSQVFSVIQRSAIMQCVMAALKDDFNLGQSISPGGTNLFPLNLFFLFFALTASLGWETAGQANPALDFGSRIMLSVIGYPSTIWTMSNGYAWIPVIVPVIGACFGAWLYDVFIFTGSSPVNSPYMGLNKIVSPGMDFHNRRQRYRQRQNPEHSQV